MPLLVLGGTAEARQLAGALCARGVEVISSLAGRVTRPALPPGSVRIGGFGGVDGLAAYLTAERIDTVIDATHPFAATITAHAAAASARTGVPLLVLQRPAWAAAPFPPATRVVPDITAAAAAVAAFEVESVFLTTGRRDLAAFAGDARHRFLVRTVDPPAPPLPPHVTVITDRGPYHLDGELALMRRHDVALLVTKNSGGTLTSAKLDAARRLGAAVIVVARPEVPAGLATVTSVSAALAWLDAQPG